ncbi:MAG: hypothetical protein WAL59_14275 [Roseiarcus sp.]
MIATKNIATSTQNNSEWWMRRQSRLGFLAASPSAVRAFIHEEPILSGVIAAGESRSGSADMSRPLRTRRQPKSKFVRRTPIASSLSIASISASGKWPR